MKEYFVNINDTVKYKDNSIVLRNCDDILDINTDVLGELSKSG
jgi:hypothetical protein